MRSWSCFQCLVVLASPMVVRADDAPGQVPPPGMIRQLGAPRFLNVGLVFTLAYSPDGKFLAAGAWDGSIRLWETATGREVWKTQHEQGWVKSLAFAPNGKMIATGGRDGIVYLWESRTGQPIRRLTGHKSSITQVAFTSDSRRLYSTALDRSFRTWDVPQGTLLQRRDNDLFSDLPFVISSKQDRLAHALDAFTLVVRKLSTWKEVRRHSIARRFATSIAFSHDDQYLAIGSFFRGHGVALWDIERDAMRLLGPEELEPYSVQFSADGKTLLCSTSNGEIQLWELATSKIRARFQGPVEVGVRFALAPDGRTLATASSDISVLLWDLTGRTQNGIVQPARLTDEEWQQSWADLASPDAEAAYRAIWRLAATPDKGLSLLRQQIKPAVASRSKLEVRNLIMELDHAQFAVRKKAAQQLEQLEDQAGPALQERLAAKPSLELRQRLQQLLDRINELRITPPPARLRVLRAVEALERMNSGDALHFLDSLAQGAEGALLTEEAKAAWRRRNG